MLNHLQLDYSAGHVSVPLDPADDDQAVRNDVTVSRIGGSSSRFEVTSGPLAVDEIGRYDTSASLSLYSDAATQGQAEWRAHVGTVDELRYPVVNFDLHENQSLLPYATAVEVGDLLSISNPPTPWQPPDTTRQVIQGWTETIKAFTWRMTFNTTPYSPFRVAECDSATYGRLGSETTTLAEDLSSGETGVDVAVETGSALWVTTAANPGEFPFSIMVDGEEMSVTACTGSSSPQTFTVTRAVNGVSTTHLTGAQVRLARPTYLALHSRAGNSGPPGAVGLTVDADSVPIVYESADGTSDGGTFDGDVQSSWFTAPGGSLLVATVFMGNIDGSASGGSSLTGAVTDSAGGTWTQQVAQGSTSTYNPGYGVVTGYGSVAIWTRPVGGATKMRARFRDAGSPTPAATFINAKIYIVTGQHASPIGANAKSTISPNTVSPFVKTLTPTYTSTATGSHAFGVFGEVGSGNTKTSTDLYEGGHAGTGPVFEEGGGGSLHAHKSSNSGASGSTVGVNASLGGFSATATLQGAYALLEIKPAA